MAEVAVSGTLVLDTAMPRIIAKANLGGDDIRVTGTTAAPQTLITTPAALFDGGPVVVDFSCEYVNHVPDTTSTTNAIGFDLMIDGVRMERLTMVGTHGDQNNFGPVVLRDWLDEAPRLIPAGMHTVGIAVWRWCPTQDGYVVNSPGYGGNGWGMPIRLTVTALT